ncbi:hypothetical protein GCM10022215_42260 [Nocardioides fonticola]|uniref:GAF domain-containing protein n=1 Tax=Nocardioides fonticola TaxID=450363 RepID=A0ABP7Y4H4_9ACTN
MSIGASAHHPAYPPVDLTSCEREPIHVPGAIQPHGVLLAIEEPSLHLVMASANIGELLGVPAEIALTLTLPDLLGASMATRVVDQVDAVRGEVLTLPMPHVDADPHGEGTLRGRWVELALHRSGKRVIVEIEERHEEGGTLGYATARSAMGHLIGTRTVRSLADHLAAEIRSATGFDRVMVYRFDPEWNGEVIAEAKRGDLNPFLGLHYPASDIPAQARRLYTINWIRLIADVAYRPVPVVPMLDPDSGDPLDLSFSTLRSVSPMHLEYLANMGVTASMSVSLIVEGRLWGLVSCHHYSGPHRPSHEVRATAEFLAQVASRMLGERERAEQRDAVLRDRDHLARLTTALAAADDRFLETFADHPAALAMVGAGGLVVGHDHTSVSVGEVPPADVVARILDLLRREDGAASSHDHLATLDPDLAAHAGTAAGALVVGTAPGPWLAWFRPELPRIVEWGGDPANAKLYAGEGEDVRVSPRRSFDRWREVVRGRSRPWTASHHEIARAAHLHTVGRLRLLSHEQITVVERLQRTLASQVVQQMAGIEVASQYVPATAHRLGGDWWDVLELDDGRLACVVGDVAGHGIEAVAAMNEIRTSLRAYLFSGSRPAGILDQLDRLMAGLMVDQVASVLLVVLDPDTGELEIINAGHPAPLLYGDGPARILHGISRPLLGIGDGESQVLRAVLPPGGTLVAYTDGLHERRDRDLATTMEELRRAGEPGPTEAGIGAFAQQLLDVVPGAHDDDTTVLVVRRPA